MTHILNKTNSILNTFIAEIRDENIQKDSMRFRKNLERIGEIMAYEISKNLNYKNQSVTTSLGVAGVDLIEEQPVIASILRAGLTLHQGFLNYFDRSANAFISAYRKHNADGSFDVQVEYLACPDINNKILILCDPLLATGTSMVLTYNMLMKHGTPAHTHIASVIASSDGLAYAEKHLPKNVTLWCCAVDSELTPNSYIKPGLGDAGDLAYGKKI